MTDTLLLLLSGGVIFAAGYLVGFYRCARAIDSEAWRR